MVSDKFKEVSRAELVAHLKKEFSSGGYKQISNVVDSILTNGQIHTPEFIKCLDCSSEIEKTSTKMQTIRCELCRLIHIQQTANYRKLKKGKPNV